MLYGSGDLSIGSGSPPPSAGSRSPSPSVEVLPNQILSAEDVEEVSLSPSNAEEDTGTSTLRIIDYYFNISNAC